HVATLRFLCHTARDRSDVPAEETWPAACREGRDRLRRTRSYEHVDPLCPRIARRRSRIARRCSRIARQDSLQTSEIVFERACFTHIVQAHKSRTTQVLEATGILRYVSYADEKLAEEEAPARRCLYQRDRTPWRGYVWKCLFVDKCANVLVIAHQEQLLNDGPAFTKNRET
ncbi:Cul5 protein, partial [Aphelenchoides avenae]